jgi:hypothetical protein
MQKHLDEMEATAEGPLAIKIYEATKNVVVFKDAPGAAIMDEKATAAARAKIVARICREFIAARVKTVTTVVQE